MPHSRPPGTLSRGIAGLQEDFLERKPCTRDAGPYLVMMARCGGLMQAPMKSTTFSCRVCR